MTFVDDDDAEGILAVVLSQKAGKAFIVVQAEGLVGGDVDAGIRGGVAAFLGSDDAGVVAESSLELGVRLFAQFVSVAQEQGGLGKLPRLAESRHKRLVAMMVLPAPVASESSTRGGMPAWRSIRIFSNAARMAAS